MRRTWLVACVLTPMIAFADGIRHELGSTSMTADAQSVPGTSETVCEVTSGWWDVATATCHLDTLILIDADADGYHLTSVEDGVQFDLDGDGQAEQIAWTRVDEDGSVDAWLACDRNGNGWIDDGTELWGRNMPLFEFDGELVRGSNGFEALKSSESPDSLLGGGGITDAQTETRGGVPDGQTDARDPIWPHLLLWRDTNHNGVSEPHELQPLATTGIVAISTDYEVKRKADGNGNAYQLESHATIRGSGGSSQRMRIWGVWLRSR